MCKSPTKEIKQKIREANKNRTISEEIKNKISNHYKAHTKDTPK